MGLVWSAVEAINIGWGVLGDRTAESLADRLKDVVFRRRVVQRARGTLDERDINLPAETRGLVRRLLNDGAFVTALVSDEDGEEDARIAAAAGGDEHLTGEIRNALRMAFTTAAVATLTPAEQILHAKISTIDENTREVPALAMLLRDQLGRAEGRTVSDPMERLIALLQDHRPPAAVEECDPFVLGVAPVRLPDLDPMPRYIPRDIDPRLRTLLRDETSLAGAGRGRIVVLLQEPRSGASRTLFEAVKRVHSERLVLPLVEPDDGAGPDARAPIRALAGLATESLEGIAADGSNVVIWLDEGSRHLGRGLDPETLAALSRAWPRCVVVATVHLSDLSDRRHSNWLMEPDHKLVLLATLTDEELARAQVRYPDAAEVELRALPRTLSRDVEAEYRSATLVGKAVLDVVCIWWMMGLGATVPHAGLNALLPTAPAFRVGRSRPTRRQLDDALTELTRDGDTSLIRLVSTDAPTSSGLNGDDELVVAAPTLLWWRQHDPAEVPPYAWEIGLQIVATMPQDSRLMNFGTEALLAKQYDVAIAALTRVVDESADQDMTDRALINLGGALETVDRRGEAYLCWSAAAQSPIAEVRQAAAAHLGSHTEIAAPFTPDLDGGASVAWSIQRYNRIAALLRSDDLEGALPDLEELAEKGTLRFKQRAHLLLAQVHHETGRPQVLQYLQQATQGPLDDVTVKAALVLARQTEELAGPVEAFRTLETICDRLEPGPAEELEVAMVGRLVIMAGQPPDRAMADRALGLIRRLAGSHNPQVAKDALLQLPVVLTLVGQPEAAIVEYRAVVDRGESRNGVEEFELGLLLEQADRLGEAAEAYQQSLDRRHPFTEAIAAVELGKVLITLGELDRAEEAFEAGAHAPNGLMSLVNLVLLQLQRALSESEQGVGDAAYRVNARWLLAAARELTDSEFVRGMLAQVREWMHRADEDQFVAEFDELLGR